MTSLSKAAEFLRAKSDPYKPNSEICSYTYREVMELMTEFAARVHEEPPQPSGHAICKECSCQTGGADYCYQHAPYTVTPKKDGSFIVDRVGRRRVWFDDPPLPAEEMENLKSECARQIRGAGAEVLTLTQHLQDAQEQLAAVAVRELSCLSCGQASDEAFIYSSTKGCFICRKCVERMRGYEEMMNLAAAERGRAIQAEAHLQDAQKDAAAWHEAYDTDHERLAALEAERDQLKADLDFDQDAVSQENEELVAALAATRQALQRTIAAMRSPLIEFKDRQIGLDLVRHWADDLEAALPLAGDAPPDSV